MNVWTQDIMQKTEYWKEKKISNTQSHQKICKFAQTLI